MRKLDIMRKHTIIYLIFACTLFNNVLANNVERDILKNISKIYLLLERINIVQSADDTNKQRIKNLIDRLSETLFILEADTFHMQEMHELKSSKNNLQVTRQNTKACDNRIFALKILGMLRKKQYVTVIRSVHNFRRVCAIQNMQFNNIKYIEAKAYLHTGHYKKAFVLFEELYFKNNNTYRGQRAGYWASVAMVKMRSLQTACQYIDNILNNEYIDNRIGEDTLALSNKWCKDR